MSDSSNRYYPSSKTFGRLKIHGIRKHDYEDGGVAYFASCGLLTGRERWQNMSLKMSKQLHRIAEVMHSDPTTLPDGTFDAEILDLHFTPAKNPNDNEKPFLNGEGLLVSLAVPWF